MAGQAKISGSAESAGDSELREKRAALRQAGKRLPRNTGADADLGASDAAGENGANSELEARGAAGKKRKRRRSEPQGDNGATEESEVDEAEQSDDPEFMGPKRINGSKSYAFMDKEGRRNECHILNLKTWGITEMSDVEAEVRPPMAIKHSDALAGTAGEDEDLGDGSWRLGLEELRRTQKPPEPKELGKERPQADDLVIMIREAIRHGDWKPVLDPAAWPKPESIGQAVESLAENEALKVLRACHDCLTSDPRMEVWCHIWLEQVLSRASLRLMGRREFREAARPLLRLMMGRLGPAHPGRGIAACVGRWRLVVELARVRQQASAEAASSAPPASVTAASAPSAASATGSAAAAAAHAAAAAEAADPSDEDDADDAASEEDGGAEDDDEADEDAADGKERGQRR
uniref:Uncharacterized protein n=1 Tax=Alexandrium catenella TaxID=2925 RepID=A0A7S1S606_ALECA